MSLQRAGSGKGFSLNLLKPGKHTPNLPRRIGEEESRFPQTTDRKSSTMRNSRIPTKREGDNDEYQSENFQKLSDQDKETVQLLDKWVTDKNFSSEKVSSTKLLVKKMTNQSKRGSDMVPLLNMENINIISSTPSHAEVENKRRIKQRLENKDSLYDYTIPDKVARHVRNNSFGSSTRQTQSTGVLRKTASDWNQSNDSGSLSRMKASVIYQEDRDGSESVTSRTTMSTTGFHFKIGDVINRKATARPLMAQSVRGLQSMKSSFADPPLRCNDRSQKYQLFSHSSNNSPAKKRSIMTSSSSSSILRHPDPLQKPGHRAITSRQLHERNGSSLSRSSQRSVHFGMTPKMGADVDDTSLAKSIRTRASSTGQTFMKIFKEESMDQTSESATRDSMVEPSHFSQSLRNTGYSENDPVMPQREFGQKQFRDSDYNSLSGTSQGFASDMSSMSSTTRGLKVRNLSLSEHQRDVYLYVRNPHLDAFLNGKSEDNKKYEDVLHRKYDILTNLLEEKKRIRTDIRCATSALQTEVKDKHKRFDNELQNLSETQTNVNNLPSFKTKKDFAKMRELRERRAAHEKAMNELNYLYKTETSNNKTKIHVLDKEIAEIREEMKQIRSEQRVHYLKLLEEGLDTRLEGLSWIIKSLWFMGETVSISMMPGFLDDNAIDYLFEISQKDLELLDLKIQLKEFHGKYRVSKEFSENLGSELKNAWKSMRPESPDRVGKHKTVSILEPAQRRGAFSLSFDKNEETDSMSSRMAGPLPIKSIKVDDTTEQSQIAEIKKRLKKLSRNITIKKPIVKEDPRARKAEIEWEEVPADPKEIRTADQMSNLQSISIIQDKIERVKAEIQDRRNKESKRISREFIMYNYEKRFNVDLRTVVSALLGSEQIKIEMGQQLREKKSFEEIKSSYRTFKFQPSKVTSNPSLKNLLFEKI